MASRKSHRFAPKRFYYTFGVSEPAILVKGGESVVTTTRDAGGGDERRRPIPPGMKQSSPITSFFEGNPLTGPVVVEGAKPGDVLAVHIRRIRLTRDTAYSQHIPGVGALRSELPGMNIPPARHFLWKLDRSKMTATLRLRKSRVRKVTLPLHPFLGCIGVAPAYGCVETSCTPGGYGGNMDCIETKPGTTLYLPVAVEGAYLYFGDIHAAQGDGELCCVALETSAEVTLDVRVVKKWRIDWPRLEDRTHIMTASSARPLMDAFVLAQREMLHWLESDYGFDRWEAYQLLSQAGTSRIGNVVDPRFTVVAKFPKKYLPRSRRR